MAPNYLKNTTLAPYPYRSMDTTKSVLRGIIFDCDGVLMDSEPLHFLSFKKALGTAGENLTEQEYNETYLALDDKGAFKTYFENHKQAIPQAEFEALIHKKQNIFNELVITEGVLAYPTVPEFVMSVGQRYPLAVATGSTRHEVEIMLESAGIRPYFEAIISADDVEKGKPDPESYLKAVEALNQTGKRPTAIRPEECLVIEDSKQGIVSAHSAGMKVIAVATSYPTFELKGADLVVPSIAALRVSQLEDLFGPSTPMPLPSTQNN